MNKYKLYFWEDDGTISYEIVEAEKEEDVIKVMDDPNSGYGFTPLETYHKTVKIEDGV